MFVALSGRTVAVKGKESPSVISISGKEIEIEVTGISFSVGPEQATERTANDNKIIFLCI